MFSYLVFFTLPSCSFVVSLVHYRTLKTRDTLIDNFTDLVKINIDIQFKFQPCTITNEIHMSDKFVQVYMS